MAVDVNLLCKNNISHRLPVLTICQALMDSGLSIGSGKRKGERKNSYNLENNRKKKKF